MNGNAVYTSHTLDVFNLDGYINTHTYNIYIPASYDGTEPYGLITFINSGNTGSIFASWIPVLEEKNIIMISGNGIGNTIPVFTRCGVALAGSEKLKEVLNIDTSRVFASGNSGGARSSAALLYYFPEIYHGMVPNCGASYLRQVDQDYETHEPDSHYEYTIPFTQVELNYVKSFDRRYAMMTSFDDFREGDIMNIYHNGMEPDGFKSKILETAGGHCSTTTQHFRDAVNFMEHPHIDVVRDLFTGTPEVGNGFKLDSVFISNNQLVFNHPTSDVARAYSNDPFLWNDDEGAIIRTSVEIDPNLYNENSFFNISLLDFSDSTIYDQNVGHELYTAIPNLLMSIRFNDVQPTVYVLSENPSIGSANDTLFVGPLADWSANDALDIKYHLWNQEIRIEFGKHFATSPQVLPGVKLLDDNRSIRIRTDGAYWDSLHFQQGTMLAFVSGKLDDQISSAPILLNHVEVIAAKTLDGNGISLSSQSITVDELKIKAFPNPNNGQFEIITHHDKALQIDIYDLSGKLIWKHFHKGASSQLNLKHLRSGVYFLSPNGADQTIRLVIK